MAQLSLVSVRERRRRKVVIWTLWLQMCCLVSWFLMVTMSSIHKSRPHIRFILNTYAKRHYIKKLAYSDEAYCISELRMSKNAFHKLYEICC